MSLFAEEPTGKKGRHRFNPRPPLPKKLWKKRGKFPDLSGAKAICFDVETKDPEIKAHGAGWGRGKGHIIGIALGTDDGWAAYYPIRHEEDAQDNYDPEQVIEYVREQLSREHQIKVGHNLMYDVGWLAEEGVEVKGQLWDTMIAEKLLNFRLPSNLEATGQRRVGDGKESYDLYNWVWSYYGPTRNPKSNKVLRETAMSNLYRCPPSVVGFYAESDVTLPIEVGRVQHSLLEREGLTDVFTMECELIPLLVSMRMAGVSVDIPAAEEVYDNISGQICEMQKEIDEIAGVRGLNTGSADQLQPVFDDLEISYVRTPTGKVSTAAENLEKIDHPLCRLIVDIQELKKFNGTFVEGAVLNSNVNGKVYGEFDPFGAITGRFSSKDPNLQNIPSRNELSKLIRGIFIPDEGHPFWRKYDYSSIESRLMAHYAVGRGAKSLRREYRKDPDTDYHNFCLNMVAPYAGWDISTKKKFESWRKPIKTINFGILYGMQARALARRLKISLSEAKALLDKYHGAMPYVEKTMDYLGRCADNEGFSETILGRKVYFDTFKPPGWSESPITPLPYEDALYKWGCDIERADLYKATNYTLQGSAADLMKKAMLDCWKAGVFDETGVPRLTVHDELDFSDPGGKDEAFREMNHIMETAIKFRVPIKVDGEIGKNWNDLALIK